MLRQRTCCKLYIYPCNAWLGIALLIGTAIKNSYVNKVDMISYNIKVAAITQLFLSVLTVIASLIFLDSTILNSDPLCGQLVMGTVDFWTLFLINLVKSTLFILCFALISIRMICHSNNQQ